jgi:tyrocidine synthetase-3
MQQASITFDASCEEIWPVLLSGGRVVVAGNDDIRDVSRLTDKIARYRATIIDCSPLLLGELNRAPLEQLRSLRLMINGGDVLKREYIDQLLKLGLVVNTYGPTETTICATYYDCADDVSDPIPIGFPVPGYRNVILSEEGRLQPVGIPGELCIAGPGVTRGYLNFPRLSEEKFVETDLFEESDGRLRMYRSGDLACWQADGNIRFLGRVDRQVKIRGFRIELEEIENALLKEPAISKAAVIPRSEEGREAYLCAYIVAVNNEEADIHQLRQSLSNQLPSYMVPAYFVTLDALPLTASGKVDARRLPKPERQDLYSSREFISPRSDGERQVASILKDLLKIEAIGVHDDFFEMGGDSILANRTLARIREELGGEISLRSFFQAPTVEGLAQAIEGGVEERISIPRASRDQEIPLSYPQERLWFLRQLDGDNSAYIIPRALRLKGRLDPALFERSLTEIVRRHEILRTVFVTVEGRPTQVVKPPFEFKIPVVDFSGIPAGDQRQAVEGFIVNQGNRPFDFETGPLIRMHLLKLAKEEHVLVSVEHHLIHDGWTQGVLLREFFTMYQALLENNPSPLPELPIQYADFAVWQRSYMAGERLERYIDFWKGKLDGLEPLLELPLDSPRPPVLSGRGEMKRLVIPSNLASGLYAFGKEHGATLFMTMLAVFKALLYRYSGCEDLVVGSGIANRRYKELEGMLGMVINTLVLRTTIEGSMRFSDCARAVKETALQAYEYEESPFDKVVEAVAPERSLSYMPIFQVMFSFMDTPTQRLSLPGLEFEIEGSHNQSSKFDINVVVIPPREGDELEGEILLDWEYNTDLFKPSTMDDMMRRYKNLLDFCVRYPETTVSQLPLLEEDEKEELLTAFNNTAVDYPRELSIPELFAREAAGAPERIALIEKNRLVTYRELECRAATLASKLISLGVIPDEPVAITAERSIHMVVGVLGILMAGGAYLPIARDFPPERKHYMIQDAAAGLWLVDGDEEDVSNVRYLSLQEPLDIESGTGRNIEGLSGDSLAYIMYTSGSTGKPKGVMVTHRNVVRLVKPLSFVELDESDCVLPTGPLEFDASTFELWGGLLNGVPLALVPKDTIIDAVKLKAAIREFGVTTMWMTVALFNQMLDTDIEVFGGLRNVLSGGDALSPAHINRLRERFPGIFVMNGYGPTENTTFSTTFGIDGTYRSSVPIGKPIVNSTAYVLDPCGNPQPVGVPGELWVGGDGVARGYLNAPQTTAEKFVTFDGRRLYRTGDRARWLESGVLEFLGRMDRQVKIRGFRIELGEIENCLLLHERVREAVVLATSLGGGDKELVAYLVDAVDPVDIVDPVDALADEVEDYLRLHLPAFMVPSAFVFVERILLTANGKVDRRALPLPPVSGGSAFAEPAGDFEKRLALVWGEVLGVDNENIGRLSDFFKLGGHSLKAARLGAVIHKEFLVQLPLAEIFQFSTLAEMALRIENAGGVEFWEIPFAEKKDYYPVSSVQKRLYIVQQLDPTSTVYNIPLPVSLPEGLDRSRLEEIFQRLIGRHESLRTSFFVEDGVTVSRVHEGVVFRLEEGPEVIDDFVRPFDLARAPLFRAALLEDGDSFTLLMDMHHIIGDGVSMGILEEDFAALAVGRELEPLGLQYRDYAEWQHVSRKNERLEKQERFWLEHLEGELPVLELPLDFSRPVKQDFVGERLVFEIDRELTAGLRKLAGGVESTLYMVLLSVFYILISRLSGQDDIIVGTPVAARRHVDLQKIVGIFINTLAIREHPRQDMAVKEFLAAVKETALRAFENQEFPFDQLVENVAPQSDSSRNPLFDVMFALENTRDSKRSQERENEDRLLIQRPVSRFDMTWNGTEEHDRIIFTVEFRTGLFKHETIRRWQDYYKRIASHLVNDPTQKLLTIELMSEAEKERIIYEFNDTSTDYPSESSIIDLFKRQVESTPGSLALMSGDRQVSYDELDHLSDLVAARLAARGVTLEDAVGLMMPRCNEMVIAMLGILKVGAAYLPINANWPDSRKKQVMKDSNLDVTLTESDFYMGVVKGDRARAGEWRAPDASSLAYVLYTSGSTGIPKGVLVEHRGVVRLVKQIDYMEFEPGKRLLQTGALEFDASTFEIWGSLLNGFSLVLENKNDLLVAESFKEIVSRYSIDVLFLTTALFMQLLEADQEVYHGLEWLLFGGEVVSPSHARKMTEYYPDLKLINCYGPTENTTFSTAIRIQPPVGEPVPIGPPIANSTAYVFDRFDRVQPAGVYGELLLGGDGIARGYMNRPDLTAEKFVDMGAPFGRLYRSGDLARYSSDGVIEFGGRIDQQVKIRGFRVEPEEIEYRLMSHPGIREAVVQPLGEGGKEKFLAAYIVAQDEVETDAGLINQLEKHLEESLPYYMIPSTFTFMEKIPLNTNGKVDRKALPQPEAPASKTIEPLITGLEKRLAGVWSRELGVPEESIGRSSDFFHLGGHSLKAANLVSTIHKEFSTKMPLADVFERSTLQDMADYIDAANPHDFQEIPMVEERECYPLTSSQRRLYITQQMDPSATAYNMQFILWPEGDVEVEQLNSIFSRLIQRHESLRTSFATNGEHPVQIIHDHVDFDIEVVAKAGGQSPKEQIVRREIEHFIRPFDLSIAPLLRAVLIDVGEDGFCLALDMHHIIGDGVSMELLAREFGALLKGETLPPLTLRYRDFAAWQDVGSDGGAMVEQEQYWLQELAGDLPVLELPTDFPRPAKADFAGDQLVFLIDSQLSGRLNSLAKEHGTTLFMVLLASFFVLISKLSGQDDIIVGSPVAGRRHADLESIVGVFINVLILRQQPRKQLPFAEFLSQVKSTAIKGFENQEYPFEQLMEQIPYQRDPSRNPLFDVMFTLQNMVEQDADVNPEALSDIMKRQASRYDLTLDCREFSGGIYCSLEYRTSLFTELTISRWFEHFKQILRQVAESPSTTVQDISILSDEERRRILVDWNDTKADYPADQSLPDLFIRQVEKNPEAIALVCRDHYLTYGESLERSRRFAHALSERGIKSEDVVGIMMEKSLDVMIGVLGILMAGAAYVPISKDYPETRKEFIAADCNIKCILKDKDLDWQYNGAAIDSIEAVDDGILPVLTSSQLAYIMYTSGSTGNPKGVAVEHGHVSRVVINSNYLTVKPGDHWLQGVAMEFDVSVFEIWNALLNGGTLNIVRKSELLDVKYLKKVIAQHCIDTVFLTPPVLSQLFSQDNMFLEGVKHFFVGGDELPPQLANELRACLPELALINIYGPTENGVWSTYYHVQRDFQHNVPIGKSISNSTAFIMDQDQRLVPAGIFGELCVGGPGVARGYVNLPDMTADKFVPFDPATPPTIYRTGDRARWLPDGNIEFAGRFDHQVKIRGTRIEPGEIENLLLKMPDITEALVLARDDDTGEKHLCAYIIGNGGETDVTELRKMVAGKLPSNMVPTYFIQLDDMPLNQSGKVDRSRLPKPVSDMNSNYVAPKDQTERLLAKIWSDVLEIPEEKIGVEDEFFQLGGHSLKANQVIAHISNKLDVELTLGEIFAKPSIRELATIIRERKDRHSLVIPKATEKKSYPLSSAQNSLYILHQMEADSLGYNIFMTAVLEGEFDVQRFQEIFQILIQRHESLRTSFHLEGDTPVQIIHPHADFEITMLTVDGSPEPVIRELLRPFDLDRYPLFRAALLKIGEAKHILVLDAHHIISDISTQNILFHEFLQLYKGMELPEPALQYKDYSEWQQSGEYREYVAKQEDFWLNEYKDTPPLLDLPYDFPHGMKNTKKGNYVELGFDTNDRELILKLAAEEGGTVHIVMLAIFYILLSRISGEHDISVGVPAAGRLNKELASVVGMFINTIALRNFPVPEKSFREFLREVVQRSFKAYENQAYPFENLVRSVWKYRDSPRNPLFDSMFEVRNNDVNSIENDVIDLEGLKFSYYKLFQETTRVELDWMGIETNKGIFFTIIYSVDLFKRATIEKITQKYKSLVKSVIENCDRPICELDAGPQLPAKKTIQEQGDFLFDL